MFPTNPGNKVVVSIDSKFNEEIQFASGVKLYIDPTWKPGQHAAVTGIVKGINNKLKNKYGIQEGDEIAFSYLAVFDRDYVDNRDDIFHEDYAEIPTVQTWSNPKGMTIIREYVMNKQYNIAVCDNEGKVYELHKKVPYSVVESVMGKYPFRTTTDFKYVNVLPYGDKDYWMVEEEFLFAVKRGEEIIMLNDNVLLKPKVTTKQQEYGGLILVNDRIGYAQNEEHLQVLHIGDNVDGIVPGDTVIANREKLQEYVFWDKPYILQRYNQLIARA